MRKTGWVSWGILVFCFFLAFIHRTAVGTVKEDLIASFALSSAAFGMMSSMYFYAYMLMQIPVGLLADSWGARKTVTLGMFLGGASTLLFALANSPTALFIGRFFVGISMATVFVSMLKIQSQWFAGALFGTLSGVSVFFGNLGGAAGQTPVAWLSHFWGWRGAFGVIAAATLLSGIASFLLVRNKPQDVGLPPIAETKEGAPQISLIEGLKRVCGQKKMRSVAVFYALNQGAFLAFVGSWLVPWLQEVHKMERTSAAALSTFAVAGIMLGSILAGFISDRLKLRKPVLLAGSLLATLIWGALAFWRGSDHVVLGSLLFLMGFGSGVFPLAMAITKEVNPIAVTGTAVSVLNTIGFFGVAVATSLLGIIGDFANILLACFVMSVMSSVMGFFSHETRAQNVGGEFS